MRKAYHLIISITIILLSLGDALIAKAQNTTEAIGIVKDSISGEPIPYVSVYFGGTTIGGMTDDNGSFSLQNNVGNTQLCFTYLGYDTKTIRLRAGRRNTGLVVLLKPTAFAINEITVKPKHERYSRKNNPAVELIKKVIEHKDENRLESKPLYKTEMYEKLSIALDNFNPNLDKYKFTQKFKFIKNYLDTSEFNGRPILTVSVRENLADIYFRKDPKTQKTITKAKRLEGLDKTVDEGGITSNLEEMFQGVNIFDNNITLLLNRFVSPLSSALATVYYKYYIMDTLDVSGDKCIDLAFVPVNSESYGFTGRLYVMLDGTYAVKKFVLDTPANINLNWVEKLRIDGEYKRLPDNTWAMNTENMYANFYVVKGAQQLYAHQVRNYSKYDFSPQDADSVLSLVGPTRVLETATEQPDSFWVSNRHLPLKEKEDALSDLLKQLRKVPAFNVIIKTCEILISGYIPTANSRKETKFDFGPMNTLFSANQVEGFRMRLGGMTTANLNPYWFLSGYMAYGSNDRRFKYNVKFTHSFNKKKYHEGESLRNNLSAIQEYDIYTPGQDFLYTSKDNIFVAWKVGEPVTKMQYIRKSMLQYEREWYNGLTWKSWFKNENNEAAGTLQYIERDEKGNLYRLKDITTSEIGTQLRFAPGEKAYNGREGKESIFNLQRDAPVFKLTHHLGISGLFGGEYTYNRTDISAQKRIWLSSFGHIDAQISAGKVWNKVPFPLLVLPNTNQSITIQPEAFHLMSAMEFVADQYVNFNATYYLKGLILNRIPGINWLRLREVVSFNGIYGSLSNKNNPTRTPGLFLFPDGTQPIGSTPYMEASIGLENILKILRVDYYRRLTYNGHDNIKRGGIRIALRFTF